MGEGHDLRWEPAGRRVRVDFAGETIVETDGAYVLHETGLSPVYYVPLADIGDRYLERTDNSTKCPFKGQASYWSVVVGDKRAENALWGYENPIDKASYLKGFGAFYRDRVEIFVS